MITDPPLNKGNDYPNKPDWQEYFHDHYRHEEALA